MSRLSDEEGLAAHAEYMDGVPLYELAEWYGCAEGTLRSTFKRLGLRPRRWRPVGKRHGSPEDVVVSDDDRYGLLMAYYRRRD